MSIISDDSLHSLLAAVNSVSNSAEKDVKDLLKIISIVENSQFEFGGFADAAIILDASMVFAAFKFFENQMSAYTLPVQRENACNDIWKKNYAFITAADSQISLNTNPEVEKLSPLQVNETRNLVSSWPDLYDFLEGEAKKIDNIKCDENPLITDQNDILENKLNNMSTHNFNRIDHNLGHSIKSDYKVSSEPEDSHSLNNLAEIENKDLISISRDSINQCSSTNFEDKNFSNSLNLYDNYLPDELDYEPSEIGEIEVVSENESFESILEVTECESLSDYLLEDENSKEHSFEGDIIDRNDIQLTNCTNAEFSNTFSKVNEKISCGVGLGMKTKRCIESIDTKTDMDHSFKRDSCKKPKREISNKFDADKTTFDKMNSTEEIKLHIQEQCALGNLNKAIITAKTFIPTSAIFAQRKIFKELFIDLMKRIMDPDNSLEKYTCLKAIEDTINICLDSKMYNSELCSLIICKCLNCDISISNGKNMLLFCQKMSIPINSKAISSYLKLVKSAKISLQETISFLEYLKNICKTSFPKSLIHEILEHFTRGEESILCTEFFKLCKFLCCIDVWEIDRDCLQTFIKCCFKNNCWTQIADFFLAWVNKGCLFICLYQSFTNQFERIGLFYEKFAEELFKRTDLLPSDSIAIMGQMGVSLMLESFSRKQYSNAFNILFTLHKYDINYFQLQEPLSHMYSYVKDLKNHFEVLVFPFTIAFIALDICLHLKRPKDAYKVFQSFTLKISEDWKEEISKIRYQQLWYLLELSKQLHTVEPLGIGLVAFSDFLSRVKDFSLEERKGFAVDVQVIYNKYLINLINAQQLSSVSEFYHYSESSEKDIFFLNSQVLRGLVVYFAQNNLVEDARKLFSTGCRRKIYDIEQKDEFIWNLTMKTNWTIFEMKCAVETFIKNIMETLNDKCKINFGKKTVVKILFKESGNICSEIDCLNVYPRNTQSIKEITCNILKSIHSDIVWTECKNSAALVLTLEKMCSYYKMPSDLKESHVIDLEKKVSQSKMKLISSRKEADKELPVNCSDLKFPSVAITPLMSKYLVTDSTCILPPKLITQENTCEMSFNASISENVQLGNSAPISIESINPFSSEKINSSSHFVTPEQEQEITSSDQIISRSSSLQMVPEKEIQIINTQMSPGKICSTNTDELISKHVYKSVPQNINSNSSKKKILRKYKKLSGFKNVKFVIPKIIYTKKCIGKNKIIFNDPSSYSESVCVPLTSKNVKPKTFLGTTNKLNPSTSVNAGNFKTITASSVPSVGDHTGTCVVKPELSESDCKMPTAEWSWFRGHGRHSFRQVAQVVATKSASILMKEILVVCGKI
ncbi:uncharacterized protein NPIL_260941 [Nephila pilipes]|uniref:Uncharacterized protein n=1 Tax=Nephila pilipes TaxID=299642 RepID=A0A8X6Q932_NEPPI|nr:uncharacterized protein NPIL_260941 [Nephila pilipes]